MDINLGYLEEDLFPKLFTSYEERSYGILFYNPENKDSYDSNHAVIYRDRITDLQAVLEDIAEFYKAKGMNAIIYQSMLDNRYFEEIKDELSAAGFRSWSEEQKYMLPVAENKIVPNKEIEVRKEENWREELTQIFLEAEEPWEIDVARTSMGKENSWAFVAYVEGKPAGILYGHVNEQVCRGDYLLVSKKQRKKGIGRTLFSAYVEWCKSRKITNAYLWPDGETPERIYQEGGYRLVEVRIAGRAVKEL